MLMTLLAPCDVAKRLNLSTSRVVQLDREGAVRAVCYRLFVAGIIESMERRNTSRVSVQLRWAREQGILPWPWIVDETREAECIPAWDDPESFAKSVSRQYRRDNWGQQDVLLE